MSLSWAMGWGGIHTPPTSSSHGAHPGLPDLASIRGPPSLASRPHQCFFSAPSPLSLDCQTGLHYEHHLLGHAALRGKIKNYTQVCPVRFKAPHHYAPPSSVGTSWF